MYTLGRVGFTEIVSMHAKLRPPATYKSTVAIETITIVAELLSASYTLGVTVDHPKSSCSVLHTAYTHCDNVRIGMGLL